MLTTEQQLAELNRVVAMCKGTKFEGEEYKCIKVKYYNEDNYDAYNYSNKPAMDQQYDRIFAIALVDDTPIWLEEPFTLYQTNTNLEYSYRKQDNKLIGVYRDSNNCKVLTAIIPMENVRWEYFTLTKPDAVKQPHINTNSITDTNTIIQANPTKNYEIDYKLQPIKHSHYYKDVSNLTKLDIYRIIELYEITDPCLQHALKKLLVTGGRGHKDFKTDITNMIDTLTRKLEMMEEDSK